MMGPGVAKDESEDPESKSAISEFVYLPRPGQSGFFTFRGHRFWVEHRSSPNVHQIPGQGDTFRLTTLGRSKQRVSDLLLVAKDFFNASLKSQTIIWSTNPNR
jgi:hypothetical protein